MLIDIETGQVCIRQGKEINGINMTTKLN